MREQGVRESIWLRGCGELEIKQAEEGKVGGSERPEKPSEGSRANESEGQLPKKVTHQKRW